MTKASTEEKRETAFICDFIPDAREVYVAGDFNDWDPRATRMVKRQGVFRTKLLLASGEYEYKFIIDGEWCSDPKADGQASNAFGTTNSVIRV